MSAATVDTSLGSLRTRLDGPRRAMLRTISAVEGHDETETEAIHRIVEDRYMALPSADSVDAGKPCSVAPERPEGGPGQGEAQPPAPTNVLRPVPERFLSRVVCAAGWGHPGRWWVGREGDACCDDHIPDGWVRPDDAPAPTNEAGPFPIYDKSEVIATPRPHVHIGFLPKGCVFGEGCGR